MGAVEFKKHSSAIIYNINLHSPIPESVKIITSWSFQQLSDLYLKFKSLCHGFEYKNVSKETLAHIMPGKCYSAVFNKFDLKLSGKINFFELFIAIIATSKLHT